MFREKEICNAIRTAYHILSCPFPCRKNLIKGVFEYDSTYFVVLVRRLRCPQLL